MAFPRNHIELRDDSPEGPAHVVKKVLIDGIEVAVAEDGVDIDFTDNDPTTVTLRILPHRVSFN